MRYIVIVLCYLTFTGALHAINQQYPLSLPPSPNHHPIWSPDGEWIAYQRSNGRSGSYDLADISLLRVPVPGYYYNGFPVITWNRQNSQGLMDCQLLSWSPDSRALLYIVTQANAAGTGMLYRVDIGNDGQDHAVLLIAPKDFLWPMRAVDAVPIWSPNGRSIAMIINNNTLLTIDADGKNRVAVTDACTGFSWSPDSARIAYTTGGKLTVVDRDGENIRVLANNHFRGPLHWLPDGKTILAMQSLNQREPVKGDLWAISAQDGEIRRLTPETEHYISDVMPSPDGRRVAFIHMARVIEGDTARDVKQACITPCDTWTPIPLTSDALSIHWSADSNLIGIVTGRKEDVGKPAYQAHLFTMQGELLRTFPVDNPEFCGGVSFSPDGTRFAYSYNGAIIIDAIAPVQR